MDLNLIPKELRDLPRWVIWGDGSDTLNKRPKQINGHWASTTDPSTWSSFNDACLALHSSPGKFNGLGFVFTAEDDLCGIDLDRCRDAFTGKLTLLAEYILSLFPLSYAEVSPSRTGIKLILRGKLPIEGQRHALADGGGIEVYSQSRYFTITTEIIQDHNSPEVINQQSGINHLLEGIKDNRFNRFIECHKALAELPDAISGQAGHNATLRAACTIQRFQLSGEIAWFLMLWFNAHKCFPAWTQKELEHKLKDAMKKEPGADAFDALKETELPDDEQEVKRKSLTYRIYTPDEMKNMNLTIEYLIQDLMVTGQPMVIGAASKTLKTTLALSAAYSLTTGVPFLGHRVSGDMKKVIMFSGESGLASIRSNLMRIAAAADRDMCDPGDRLRICDTVPQLESKEHLRELARVLKLYTPDVIIIDPAYLALGGEGSENVFTMGMKFGRLLDICNDHGCLPCIVHHTKKSSEVRTGLSLGDMSWAGWSEFAGQWWLLSRQNAFNGRVHNLRLQAGSRVGSFADLAITVDEGEPRDINTPRDWIEDVTEWEDSRKINADETQNENKDRIVLWLQQNPGKHSLKTVRVECFDDKRNGTAVAKWLRELVDEGTVFHDDDGYFASLTPVQDDELEPRSPRRF